MKTVSPRVDETALAVYPELFLNPHFGYTYILEAFPVLYKRTLFEIRRKKLFTGNELKLILDVFNGTMLTSFLAGQHIDASVQDAIYLDRLNEKWEIDGKVLIGKIESMSVFEKCVLEIWANAFWYSKKKHDDLEKYVSGLLEV
jgi:hypothetical protein